MPRLLSLDSLSDRERYKVGPFLLPGHRQSSSSASQEPEESTLQISNQLVQQSFIMLFLNVFAVVAIATGASAAAIIPRLERLAQFRVFGATECNYDNLGVSVAVEGDASFGTCTSLKGDDVHSIFATTIHDDCHCKPPCQRPSHTRRIVRLGGCKLTDSSVSFCRREVHHCEGRSRGRRMPQHHGEFQGMVH